mmetsp:Transcript_75564/g.244475  ORF Transcript_75564/g.244475 Transcript_75564/m.244475 type:complete len:94 (+) Transcript_75564:512-793(+)
MGRAMHGVDTAGRSRRAAARNQGVVKWTDGLGRTSEASRSMPGSQRACALDIDPFARGGHVLVASCSQCQELLRHMSSAASSVGSRYHTWYRI